MGNCETNPAEKVKLEKFDNTRIAYLLDDEIERIFKYLDRAAKNGMEMLL